MQPSLWFLSVAVTHVGAAACPNIFVSITGDDAADGCSSSTPVASLARAQQLSRASVAGGANNEATVVLLGDSTPFQIRGQGIQFTSADNGVRWTGRASTAGEIATVSGAVVLPTLAEWSAVTDPAVLARIHDPDAKKAVRQLVLDDHPTLNISATELGALTRHGFSLGAQPPPMELFFNGTRLQRARWPKATEPPCSMAHILNPNKSAPVFAPNSTRPLTWTASLLAGAEDDGVWLDGIVSQNWVWTYNRVRALPNGSLTFAYPEVDDLMEFSPSYCCHNRFFFDNVFEEIREPGEYYINTTSRTLYLIPPPGSLSHGSHSHNNSWNNATTAPLVASVLTTPIFSFDASATNVTIENLSIGEARGDGIDAQLATGITLANLEVSNVGLNGIRLGANSTVKASHLHDLGGGGVSMQAGDTDDLVAGRSAVHNCHIHRFASWSKVYTPGVSVGGVGNAVEHCEIHDGPHCGMLVYGNDHFIANNTFFDLALEYVDMGAIYVNLGLRPLQRGTRIANNFFHHLGTPDRPLVVGVYPDSSTMGLNVHGNVFYKVSTDASAAVMGNGFSYINTTNNVYVDCTVPFKLGDWLRESWGAANYPQYAAAWKATFAKANASGTLDLFYTHYPELRNFFSEDRIAPKSNTFATSIVFNPTVPRPTGNASTYGFECIACDGLSDVQRTSSVWLTSTDPGFASVADMNFSLPAALVVPHIPQWVEIPFATIGLETARVGPRRELR